MAQILLWVNGVPPKVFKPGHGSSLEGSNEELAFHGASHQSVGEGILNVFDMLVRNYCSIVGVHLRWLLQSAEDLDVVDASCERIISCTVASSITTVLRVGRGPRASIASWWWPPWGRSSWGSPSRWTPTVAWRSHADGMPGRSGSGRTYAPSPFVTG